jgi:hypothetical protein
VGIWFGRVRSSHREEIMDVLGAKIMVCVIALAGRHLVNDIGKPINSVFAVKLYSLCTLLYHCFEVGKQVFLSIPHNNLSLEKFHVHLLLHNFGLARINTGSAQLMRLSHPSASPTPILRMACTESIGIGSLELSSGNDLGDIGIRMSDVRWVWRRYSGWKPKLPVELSERPRDLIERMLKRDSDDRIDIEGTKNHLWCRALCYRGWYIWRCEIVVADTVWGNRVQALRSDLLLGNYPPNVFRHAGRIALGHAGNYASIRL